jgi:hypothetical protein
MTSQVAQQNRLTRKQGSRPARTRFSIYCEGTKTEKDYFELVRAIVGRGYARHSVPLIAVSPAKGNPLEIVDYAIRDALPGRISGDEVWCVFDVESPHQHPYINEAAERARKRKISCAISNPCFELWLILHFEHCNRHMSTDAACRRLETLLKGYSRRGKRIVSLDKMMDHFDEARTRARLLDASFSEATPVSDRNPSTSVWTLTERLLSLRPSTSIADMQGRGPT